ncbi:hypothetical protein D3C71_1921140 [compost metagenome]
MQHGLPEQDGPRLEAKLGAQDVEVQGSGGSVRDHQGGQRGEHEDIAAQGF